MRVRLTKSILAIVIASFAAASAVEAQMIPDVVGGAPPAPAATPSPKPAAPAATPAPAAQPAVAPSPQAAAQAKQAAEAKAKEKVATAEAGKKSYAAGVKAFEAGKHDQAIQSLTAALRAGLPSQQMAKAMFYRGSAYRKQGKPGAAISDLTSAVWLKNGLTDSERLQAIEARKAAYREAGLNDQGTVPEQVVTANGASSTEAPAPSAIPTVPAAAVAAEPKTASAAVPATATAPIDTGPNTLPWQTPQAAATPPPPAPTVAAPIPVATPASQPIVATAAPQDSALLSPIAPAPKVKAAPEPVTSLSALPQESAPSPAVVSDAAPSTSSTSLGTSLGGVGKFFSNMFNGGGTQTAANTQTQPAPATAPVAVATPQSATSSWADNTQVAAKVAKPQPAAKPAPTTTAALAPAPAPVAPAVSSASGGKYRLQIAAVRSKPEADQVVQKLLSEHGPKLASRQPLVDEAVVGNFGTFFRVRLGPYADANEPKQLCQTLRPSGFDCFVISQ